MPLTCDCDWDPEPGWLCWSPPEDYSTLDTTRRKRCGSCGNLIDLGAVVAKFHRFKLPESVVEVQIYNEDGEIPRAPSWLCETCADLYFSLAALGFCPAPSDDMRALVGEYAQTYGPESAP